MSLPLCIISLTKKGQQLALKLQKLYPQESEVLHKPKPFKENIQQHFLTGQDMLFICATGIIIRTLAPVLQHKNSDPAILAMDEQGQFIIPLLSGHEGGANDLAQKIAMLLASQLVLTTANTYCKPIYTVGMGCERGCTFEHLNHLLIECLNKAKLSIDQIQIISSLDVKQDELGLIQLAKENHCIFETYQPQLLRQVEHLLTEKSTVVFNAVGVYGVAEAAALVSAKRLTSQTAELVLSKQKTKKATCAIAKSILID